jgi:malonyl-CoA O-methyltransferase
MTRLVSLCRRLSSLAKRREKSTMIDPQEGYQLWADTYDDRENNALLHAEERAIDAILEQSSLAGKKILDAGCGTGRHIERMRAYRPAEIHGIDASSRMIERARPRFAGDSSVYLHVADLSALPYGDGYFDFVICTLALDHLPDLGAGIRELSRVLRPSAEAVASVFHPKARELGWERTFRDVGNGRLYAVEYFGYRRGDYESAFQAAGLSIAAVTEPVIDESLKPYYKKAGRIDLYNTFKGAPLLLIFRAIRL